MSITLTFSHMEMSDGTCVPVRFYESEVKCRNGLEKIAAEIQEACIEAAKKVLEKQEGSAK